MSGDGITVQVRVSGRLAGGGTRRVRLPAGATAAELVDALAPELGLAPERLTGVAVAVGGEIAARDHRLGDGDAVSVIVPVAGGG